MGLIKENSALARKSKMYFEDFQNAMLDNPQNLDFGLYRTRLVEKEAYLVGDMAESEVSGECLFSKLKNNILQIKPIKNYPNNCVKEMKKIREDMQKHSKKHKLLL